MKHALAFVACAALVGCSNNPPASPASYPPVADLTCPAEPEIAAMLASDPTGLSFDIAVRAAGEQCRSALRRVCEWHKARGATVDCDRGR